MSSQVIKTRTFSDLVESIIAKEESILSELDLEHYLDNTMSQKDGLKRFAEAFYFVRYNFTRLNFILGERCGANEEFLWAGLAKNLMEELGGIKGPSHNQLYRDFLSCVGIHSEKSLREPIFAYQFNASWEKFCRDASLPEALSAIAIYEIFDKPDYALLLRVIEKAGVAKRGLRFFTVHAVAEHFNLFEDTISWLSKQEKGEEIISNGINFVFRTQRMMWAGLLNTLDEQCCDALEERENKSLSHCFSGASENELQEEWA
ncbi:MAG: iron-containing redox enzyme family protein [Scytonema sp. RU_4_4]|nr:iron-containing redox enzyme family protein [Scytonema sp. RU_4_4]